MIPSNTISGILPPFVGANPATAAFSPYDAAMTDVVKRYAGSAERVTILRGLLTYRSELLALGIDDGFQWIDGSFVEDVEKLRGRPPQDVDLVTFAYPPTANRVQWMNMVNNHPDLFDPQRVKARHHCDAYFVDLGKRSHLVVADTAYWFGLFSHQRVTSTWKGMLRVPLVSDDVIAAALL